MAKPIASLFVVLLVSVGGCIASEGTGASPQENDAPVAGPAAVNDTSGAVEGLVIDEESVPIEGAVVAFVSTDIPPASSDATGRFVMNGISPGSYQLAVAKLGYSSSAKQVEVLAGEVTQATFTLEMLEVHDSYHRTFVEKGYFECSWTGASTGPCFFPIVGNNSAIPVDPWTNNRRSFDYGVEAGAVTVFNEMTWDRTTAATGERMSLFLSYKERTTAHNYCFVNGLKPGYLRWDRAMEADGAWSEENDEPGECRDGTNSLPDEEPQTIPMEGQMLTTRVNTGPGNVPVTGTSTVVGVAFQQSFEVYISYFFWEYAPEGWTALSDT